MLKIKAASAFILALGLTAQYPASASGDTVRLRRECTAERCVYYEGSRRIYSEQREQGTGRTVIRDRRGNIRAKVKENERGTLQVERYDQRR